MATFYILGEFRLLPGFGVNLYKFVFMFSSVVSDKRPRNDFVLLPTCVDLLNTSKTLHKFCKIKVFKIGQ